MNVMNQINGAPLRMEERNIVDKNGRSRSVYMHTANGKKYYPLDPRPEEVHIEVIAHHLAAAARWSGSTQKPLSVAQHSCLVMLYMIEVLDRPDLALEALLHDASEAYIGDLIRPLKYSPEFREPFSRIEELNERAIAERFNLIYPFPVEIKMADEAVTQAEWLKHIPMDPTEEWQSGIVHEQGRVAPYKIDIVPFETAKGMFMSCYAELMRERAQYRPIPGEILDTF